MDVEAKVDAAGQVMDLESLPRIDKRGELLYKEKRADVDESGESLYDEKRMSRRGELRYKDKRDGSPSPESPPSAQVLALPKFFLAPGY